MALDTNTSNNLEIDQALKEFEAKSNTGGIQGTPRVLANSSIPKKEVSGITFETDSYKAVKFYNETKAPKIIQLVIKYSRGMIKEQKQAEYALFGFVVIATFISLFLFFSAFRSPSPPPADQIIYVAKPG